MAVKHARVHVLEGGKHASEHVLKDAPGHVFEDGKHACQSRKPARRSKKPAPVHMNPSINPVTNPSSESESDSRAAGGDREDNTEIAFANFWAVYPKRRGKNHARQAFKAAIKGASAADIIAGARRYAAERARQDPRYTKHPRTWLNGGCWEDEPEATGQTNAGQTIDQDGNIVESSDQPRSRAEEALAAVRRHSKSNW
jgi:hypothetical protein